MSSPRALKPAQALAMLLTLLLLAAGGGLVLAGTLLPIVTPSAAITAAGSGLVTDLPKDIELPRPSEQSIMLAADGSQITSFYAQNRIVVTAENMSPHVRNAAIAIEDRRFLTHNGVDIEGMVRALINNIGGGRTEGASTITQQFIKNMLVEQGEQKGDKAAIEAAREQSISRKIIEARLAMALEKTTSKEEILTGYLNIAPFGPSVYGVEAASTHYFSKHAKDLNPGEAALLAGITQSPNKWDPIRHPEDATIRRNLVLKNMLDLKFIDKKAHDTAKAIPVAQMLKVTNSTNGCAAAGEAAYFCEYVVKDLLNNESWGKDRAERTATLMRGGLIIKTTLDRNKQKAAFEAVKNAVPINDASGIKMALSTVESKTGNIIAMAQNTNFGRSSKNDPSATQVNLNVGQSHGGGLGFQTGSTFKPIVLTQWLRTGHDLNTPVAATKRLYPRNTWNISCNPQLAATYKPRNLEGTARSSRMRPIDALKKSVNLPFVEMANQMDMCDVVGLAGLMGMTQGNGEPLLPNPAAVLGSNTVPPLQVTSAFSTYANSGTHCQPNAILEITDRRGTPIEIKKKPCQQVLDSTVAGQATYAMTTVVGRGGTGSRAILPGDRPAAGKTGTANNDTAAWFVGFTPQYTTGIWMGHQQGTKSMVGARVAGRRYSQIYGGLIPAPTWKNYMAQIHEGLPNEPLHTVKDSPSNSRDEDDDEQDKDREDTRQVSVPDVVGYSVKSGKAQLEAAGFKVVIGEAVKSEWEAGGVASVTPGVGAEVDHGSTVTISPSKGP